MNSTDEGLSVSQTVLAKNLIIPLATNITKLMQNNVIMLPFDYNFCIFSITTFGSGPKKKIKDIRFMFLIRWSSNFAITVCFYLFFFFFSFNGFRRES